MARGRSVSHLHPDFIRQGACLQRECLEWVAVGTPDAVPPRRHEDATTDDDRVPRWRGCLPGWATRPAGRTEMNKVRRNLTRIAAQGALTLTLVGGSVLGVNLWNDRDVATASAT